MTRFSAILGACVLVPITLADSLLRLAECGTYRPLWSTAIIEEMVAAICEVHPALSATLASDRADAMNAAFEDAEVSGWEGLVTGLTLPDPKDRHVLAAAIVGRADVIVTSNLKDFPSAALEPFKLEAQSPDTFLMHQLDLSPKRALAALDQQAHDAKRPSLTIDALIDSLARCGVPQFARAARANKWRIGRSIEAWR